MEQYDYTNRNATILREFETHEKHQKTTRKHNRRAVIQSTQNEEPIH